MARGIPSWAAVSGLTAAALVAVSFLAIQASGQTPQTPRAVASPHPTASHPHTPPPPPAVPGTSGTGKRVVYSLSQKRVWIVPTTGKPVDTFVVHPGTVAPKVGLHHVSGRKATSVGSDGANVEHVVFFSFTAETWIAFSAQLDDKLPPDGATLRTGAVRTHRKDGDALWNATAIGTPVIVVP
ncbi:hypothetical protein AB0M29_35600 [Streptomyces sp. NPDC051976]|uniref:hypothetical protein n=1 Tax=Streptomyces sp. NPDC051976 TaxID=3154947 RepID=UPI00343DD8B8